VFKSRKELVLCLEKFKAVLGCITGVSLKKASLQKIWVKKVERICQGVLNLVDKFLEEFGFEHQ
jgi:hypothetical protein